MTERFTAAPPELDEPDRTGDPGVPAERPEPAGGRRAALGISDPRWLLGARWVGVAVGLASLVVGLLLPAAPVLNRSSEVTWPAAGQAPTPTTAFLLPYRPAELSAQVPCTAIRAARSAPEPRTVLATTADAGGSGLVVRTEEGAVQVLLNGRRVPLTVPEDGCDLRVDADARGVRLAVADTAPTVLAGDPVPEVFAFTTDLTGADARGLSIRARTPALSDTVASPGKERLVTLQVQLAVTALGLLVVVSQLARPHPSWPRPSRSLGVLARQLARGAGRRVLRPASWFALALDAAVIALLAWWAIVGPLTDDDGFASVIARAAADTGQVGNYYRWFNVSEAPFASSQRLLGLFADDLSPVALRVPSVLAGVAVWLLLSRSVLPRLLPPVSTRAPGGDAVLPRVLLALGLGIWWLPYDLGVRPEPWVALGSVVVLALVLRATDPASRHRLAAVGAAAGVATATLTVAPSGLVALVPIVLRARPLVRVLATGSPVAGSPRPARPHPWPFVAHLVLVAGVAAVASTIVFADQSWHGVVASTTVHDRVGPSQAWYAEWLRYGYLLGDDSWGSATKRLPVLLAVVLTLPATTLLLRRGRDVLGAGPTGGGGALAGLAAAPVGLVVLAATPSKWTHHFGSLAGFGALFVAAVGTALWRAAREAGHRDGAVSAAGAVGALGVVGAGTASFSGPNAWWGYSGFGLAWSTGPVDPFDSPTWWLAAVAVGLVVVLPLVVLSRPRDDTGDPAPPRGARWTGAAAVSAPLVATVTAAAVSLGVLVSSFGAVAADRGGTYSLAGQNEAALARPGSGDACGIENHVEVLDDLAGGPLAPVPGAAGQDSAADLAGFVAGGAYPDPPPSPGESDRGRFTWGSDDGPGTTGSLTTRWFALPALRPGQEVALSVAGYTDQGASVSLEFGTADGRASRTLGRRPVAEPAEPQRGYRGYAPDPERERLQDQGRDRSRWRTVTVPRDAVPPGSDRVRVLAVDDRADDRGWVAATGPRLVDVVPLRRWLADRGPVLVDWPIAFALPCRRDLPRVADGVAAAPGAWLAAPRGPRDPLPAARLADRTIPDDIVPERWVDGTDALTSRTVTAGSFAGMTEVGEVNEIDTRLVGDPGRVWGRLLVPDYGDLERDAYDRRVITTPSSGLEGDPAPVRDPRPPGFG